MLTAKDIVRAHKVLKDVVVNTPLDYDHYLSEKYGAKIYLKKENATCPFFQNPWCLLCHFSVEQGRARTWGCLRFCGQSCSGVSHTLVMK